MALVDASRAMELLPAALGNHLDLATDVAAVFRRVVRGKHANFSHRVNVGAHRGQRIAGRIHTGNAVHREVGLAAHAIQVHLAQGERVHRLVVALSAAAAGEEVGSKGYAGQGLHERQQVASADRDVFKLLEIDHAGVFAGSRLDRRRGRGHFAPSRFTAPTVRLIRPKSRISLALRVICVLHVLLRIPRGAEWSSRTHPESTPLNRKMPSEVASVDRTTPVATFFIQPPRSAQPTLARSRSRFPAMWPR